MHLNSSSPRRHTFPAQKYVANNVKQTRFAEPESVTMLSDRNKGQSFANDRALNPSISEAELDSLCYSEVSSDCRRFNRKLSIGSSIGEDSIVDKTVSTKSLSSIKSPIFVPAKASSTTTRRQATPKIYTAISDHDLQQKSQTPSTKTMRSTRRSSLPLSAKATSKMPYKASTGLLHNVASPDVSVNAPRIDKMTEFPLASSDDPLFPVRKTSSTSAQCSSTSPSCDNNSITKDKCTVQIVDKSRRTVTRSYIPNFDYSTPRTRSECSENKPTTCISSRPSSESGSQQNKFDTSSYQQRAEALEGLLEFSAKLMQQNRFQELSVLLKPFGPEKVSSRETAIWLTKSFKETSV